MRYRSIAATLALLALGSVGASAKPLSYALPDETAALKPGRGAGFEAAQANCASCHSVDYVATQPPRLGPTFWSAEVQKMIKVYHAPIEEPDATAIAAYLAETY